MKSTIRKYAKLIVKIGACIRKDDDVLIISSIEGAPLAQAITEYCYKSKAKRVTVTYADDKAARLHYLYQDEETLKEIPSWEADMKNSYSGKHAVTIRILTEDPHLFDGVDPGKIAARSRAAHKAFKAYYDNAMANKIRWTLCAVPGEAWAKTVFPDLSPSKAVAKLWDLIIKAMRLDCKDSIKAWQEFQAKSLDRIQKLNGLGLVRMKYKNSLGTDFTIGLPKGAYFSGAKEDTVYGAPFCANMPTEEIFTLPDKNTGDGKIVASMPLVHNGTVIEDFFLELKDGKIVNFDAKKGYETLKNIIETDEGSRRLGEIALVQYDSPIQNLHTLFYNTLFDENASCHFAIGRAYPLIVGADKMTDEQLEKLGVNFSDEHVDFMVGTPDLEITGISEDGTETPIFRNGNFCF